MNCHCVLLLKVVVCLSKAIVKTSVCNMNLTMWNLAPALTFRMAPCGRWRLGEKWNKWRSLLQRLTHSVSVIFGHNARTHEDKYLSPPICVGHYNPSNVSSVWRLIRHRQVGTNIRWHTHAETTGLIVISQRRPRPSHLPEQEPESPVYGAWRWPVRQAAPISQHRNVCFIHWNYLFVAPLNSIQFYLLQR